MPALGQTMMETGWCLPAKSLCLMDWLVPPLWTVCVFSDEHWHMNQRPSHSVLTLEVQMYVTYPDLLVPNFPFFLSIPLTNQLGYLPLSMSSCDLGLFLFPHEVDVKYTTLSSTYWEHFPTPLPFRETSDWSCSESANHFQLIPTSYTNSLMNTLLRGILLHQLVKRDLQCCHRCNLREIWYNSSR